MMLDTYDRTVFEKEARSTIFGKKIWIDRSRFRENVAAGVTREKKKKKKCYAQSTPTWIFVVHATQEARQLDENIDRGSGGEVFRACGRNGKVCDACDKSVIPTESHGLTSMESIKFIPAIQSAGIKCTSE